MQELAILKYERSTLNAVLDNEDWRELQRNWTAVRTKIQSWWRAYKKWEAKDTFTEAYQGRRMSVRTFGNDFDYQKSKTFGRGTIKVPDNRFHADSRYTPMSVEEQRIHNDAFRDGVEHQKYFALRGIDSSAFANPASFLSRETKYDEGLHDLSASLVNPDISLFKQIHNNEEGANFSFLPLSEEEDQEILYDLGRCAKALKQTFPDVYNLVRTYKAEMTRVKLAQEFDMGVGYTAVPIQNPGTGPQYKLRYGLGTVTTIPGRVMPKKVTGQDLDARRTAARKFKSILGIRDAKNEIVIAIRKHAGAFPMYAKREGNVLLCYNIVNNDRVFNGLTISAMGEMVRAMGA